MIPPPKRTRTSRAWTSLLVLASVLVPALASASIAAGPKTRVMGFDLAGVPRVGLEGDLSRTSRQAYGLWYGGLASGSLVAPSKGTTGTTRLRDPQTGRFVSDPANAPSSHTFTDAQRRAAWKKLAEDPNSPLTAEQRAQIKARRWRGPQRTNPRTGELETMELSHEPIPLRQGGAEVVPRWPADHAAVDPHRHLKKPR